MSREEAVHVGEVDGVGEHFSWPAGMTLLDALLSADIPARYEIEHEDQTLASQTIRDGEGPYEAVYD